MSILYAAVSCGKRILCEQSIGNADFGSIVRQHLDNNLQEYVTFALGRYTFNSINHNGISYITIVDISTSQQQTLSFLRAIETKFVEEPSRLLEAQSGSEHCHQIDFGRILSEQMSNFAKQDNGRLMELRSQVNDVGLLMDQNIKQMNERGGRLDDIVKTTAEMENDASMFHTTARRVKQKTYCENLKMKIILFGSIGILVFVILMIILWQTGVFDK